MRPSLRAVAASLLLALSSSAQAPTPGAGAATAIPPVESWTEPEPFVDDGKANYFIRWHLDPSQPGGVGLVVYLRGASSASAAIAKCWNFQSEPFSAAQARCALRLEDGSWFVGDAGETIKFESVKDAAGAVVGMSFRYTGRNSSVSRTVQFQAGKIAAALESMGRALPGL